MPQKKTDETSESSLKKISEKTEENKGEKTEVSEEKKEFPDIELGIDVFSAASTTSAPEEPKKSKIEDLKEKAKKMAEKIEGAKETSLKEELKESEEKRKEKNEKTLFPLDDYVKYSAHLGTKAVTPNMRQFVYKRRADGLAVLNTNAIDKKLKEAVEFLANYKPEDIFLACKREAGWPAAKKFAEATGIKVFTKKYPAGVITNSKLTDFFEVELVIVCDPWLDKNALNDAVIIKRPVIALCDTNNLTSGVTKVIPCNNKAGKSLGLILYLLAREYLKAKGEKKELNLEDFAGSIEEKEQIEEAEKISEKKIEVEKAAEQGV